MPPSCVSLHFPYVKRASLKEPALLCSAFATHGAAPLLVREQAGEGLLPISHDSGIFFGGDFMLIVAIDPLQCGPPNWLNHDGVPDRRRSGRFQLKVDGAKQTASARSRLELQLSLVMAISSSNSLRPGGDGNSTRHGFHRTQPTF